MDTNMKTQILFISLFCSAICSCQKFEKLDTNDFKVKESTLNITAVIEENPSSKVYFDEVEDILTPSWQESDKLIGFDESGSKFTFSIVSFDGRKANFKNDGQTDPVGKVYMIYAPGYSTTYIINNSLSYGFSNQSTTLPGVMLGTGTVNNNSLSLTFTNACAIFCIKGSVGNNAANKTICKIALTGPNMKDVATAKVENGVFCMNPTHSGNIYRTVNHLVGNDGSINDLIMVVAPAGAVVDRITIYDTESTPYYYCPATPVTAVAGKYYRITNKTFTRTNPSVGFDCVDLGLSVKWSTCNLGATQSNQIGSFYMWGLTTATATDTSTPSSAFSWSNYPYYSGSYDTVTKYCTMSKCGTVDNKTTLELSDDAAYKSLKDGWRMPTETEFQNLINNCTWTYGEQDGVKGYFATSNVSGYTSKSIFFPFSGEYCESYMYSQSGIYWTSTLETSYNNNSARAVEIHDPSSPYYYANLKCTIPMRHWGCVIRPVFSDQMPIQFYDYDTKQKCVSLWDTNKDGELSYAEAAAVTSFRGLFYNQTQISYFEEFQYFTGLTDIRYTYKDEDGAFEGCTSLEKIILPENLISIDRYSFDGCTSLKKITIPAKVKYIGESAFYGCSKLFCVTVLAEIPPIFDDDTGDEFGGIKKGAALYVPKGSLESYQKSDWAKFFASISEIIE